LLFILSVLFPVSGSCGEPVELVSSSGKILGTLEVPKIVPLVPVALIIAGSGPTDRDGNNIVTGRNDSLKLLAKGLASRGIASLRYDKRGIAASAAAGPREEDLRFETYIDDAMLWGRFLRKDKRFSKLVVIGHSEGSLIGMLACRRLGAEAFISIAGTGQLAAQLIETQIAKNAPPDLVHESRIILEKLKRGNTTDQVPFSLLALFRPSVQPYLISWFRYDPVHEISQLTVPILIIQGTTDIQVGISDAGRLLKANNRARMVLLEGMNHVLKHVPPDIDLQIKSYGDPSLPIHEGMINAMAVFIRELNISK